MKEAINNFFNSIANFIDRYKLMVVLNIIIFTTLIMTAMYMYKIGNVLYGNDILLATGLYLIFNKIDRN